MAREDLMVLQFKIRAMDGRADVDNYRRLCFC